LTASQVVHASDGGLHEGHVGWATDAHLTELVNDDGEGAVSERGAGSCELGHLTDESIDVVLLHELVDLSHVGQISGITEVLVAHLAGAEERKGRRDNGSVLGPEDSSVLETGLLGSRQLRVLGIALKGHEGILTGLDIGGADCVSGSAGSLCAGLGVTGLGVASLGALGVTSLGVTSLCVTSLCVTSLCVASLGVASLCVTSALSLCLGVLSGLGALGDGGTSDQAGSEKGERERGVHFCLGV